MLNRPGQGAVAALTFGMVGAHPLVLYALQVALSAVTAVLLYKLLRRFVGNGPALATAGLWLVVPNHGSLVRWASAAMILVSLALLLGALLLLTRAAPDLWSDSAAAVLLVGSVLCYEATAPAAVVAALVLPRLVQGEWRWRASIMSWVGVGGAVAWVLSHFNPSKKAIHATADLSSVFPAHFGWGVVPGGVLARVLVVVALIGLTVIAFRSLAIGKADRRIEWFVPGGLAVIVLGTLPFVRYFYEPVGVGDRVNVVAGIGTALCWYGLGRVLWQWRRPLGVAVAGLVLAAMSVATIEGASDWHRAEKSADEILAALPRAARSGMIVVGPGLDAKGNVTPFQGQSDVQAAVRMRLDDRSATARVSRTLDDFASVAPELRVDVRTLSP